MRLRSAGGRPPLTAQSKRNEGCARLLLIRYDLLYGQELARHRQKENQNGA
jgi:hypothetical protein